MSWPPLDSNTIGTNTTSRKMSQMDSITIEKKRQNPRHKHDQQNRQHNQQSFQQYQRILQREKEKRMYQRTRIQTHHRQTHHWANLIGRLIEIVENLKERNAIQTKSAKNRRNRTHRRAILIRLTTVTIYARDAKRRSTLKKLSYRIMRKVNGKVSDNSIWIKDHQVKTGQGSAPAPDLFS